MIFRFLENHIAPFYIFSTKSAEEILLIESYQVINDFKYWLKDLRLFDHLLKFGEDLKLVFISKCF